MSALNKAAEGRRHKNQPTSTDEKWGIFLKTNIKIQTNDGRYSKSPPD
jgi:hypothetical protein